LTIGQVRSDIAGADPLEESEGWRAAISEIGSCGPTDAIFRAVIDGTRRLTIDLLTGRACEDFDLDEDPGEIADLLGTSRGRAIETQLRELMAETLACSHPTLGART
jgi:hypothetical protein